MQHEVILHDKYDNTTKGLGIVYAAEIAEDDLKSIEYDLNSNIARLETILKISTYKILTTLLIQIGYLGEEQQMARATVH
mgnify:CR=1 FL=1